MKAKILKNEADYEAALAYVSTLMEAEPGSQEEEELELFSLLVEQYEDIHYPIAPPDPVDAILFRMEQEGLTRREMVTYLGSQSKVSEVLNRKRPLSLAMIRSLHEGLQIPADVLLQEPGRQLEDRCFESEHYPLNEMRKRGYFGAWKGNWSATKEHAEELLQALFAPFQGHVPQAVTCRRSETDLNDHALQAWQARVLALAQAQSLPPYKPDSLDDAFFKKLVRASYFSDGPRLAATLLNEYGISLITLPHLPKTYLDGACFLSPAGHPVIGMTLRHDRLDNFWFTLAHEVAHVRLHLHDANVVFFDDVEHVPCADDDTREIEANEFAQELLLPATPWAQQGQMLISSCSDAEIKSLADRLEISPAIIAGRIRWASGDYTRHAQLIGQGAVRHLFAD